MLLGFVHGSCHLAFALLLALLVPDIYVSINTSPLCWFCHFVKAKVWLQLNLFCLVSTLSSLSGCTYCFEWMVIIYCNSLLFSLASTVLQHMFIYAVENVTTHSWFVSIILLILWYCYGSQMTHFLWHTAAVSKYIKLEAHFDFNAYLATFHHLYLLQNLHKEYWYVQFAQRLETVNNNKLAACDKIFFVGTCTVI